MSERDDLDFLRDIKEAINRIHSYTNGIDYKEFLKDSKTQDAVVRNLEIIGEATKTFRKNSRKNIRTSRGKKWRGPGTRSYTSILA